MGIFKAYDIRGIVPADLDDRMAFRIGHGFAVFLRETASTQAPVVVVAQDMREHSPGLAASFALGVEAAGGSVIDCGMATTPMLYCAVGRLAGTPHAPHGGAMITASHNGPQYNGMKLCRASAVPISADTGLKRIEELSRPVQPGGTQRQRVRDYPRITEARCPAMAPHMTVEALWHSYWEHVSRFKRSWPKGLSVAVDPANGMGCLYLPLLDALGANVTAINEDLDGTFPAHEANPVKVENTLECSELVRNSGASLGVCFDGDADRVVFLDRNGKMIPSDLITAVLAKGLLSRERGASILYDLRSSRSVREVIEASGGKPVRERVGHSFMKATMRKHNCVMGGELSGHFYWRENWFADSSLITVIEVLNRMGETGKTIDQLVAEVAKYHASGELNFHVEDKDEALECLAMTYKSGAVDRLDGVTVDYPDWWCNVRPSNTEPLLRLNVEAVSKELLESRLEDLKSIIGGKPE